MTKLGARALPRKIVSAFGITMIDDHTQDHGIEYPSLVDSLRAEMVSTPDVAASPLGVLALRLAGLIDDGIKVPECSRELRQCLLELRITYADTDRKSTLDQLQAKREQRRQA